MISGVRLFGLQLIWLMNVLKKQNPQVIKIVGASMQMQYSTWHCNLAVYAVVSRLALAVNSLEKNFNRSNWVKFYTTSSPVISKVKDDVEML